MSRDVCLGHDPAAGAPFIDHGDAPNLILLHHLAAVLDAHFRRDCHAGAGHAISRHHFQRVIAFGHGPATDVAVGHDSRRLHTLSVIDHRDPPAVTLDHHPGDFLQVCVRRTTGRVPRHDVIHSHDCSPYRNSYSDD